MAGHPPESRRDGSRAGCRDRYRAMNAPVTNGGPGVTNGVMKDGAENRRFRFPLWFWAVYAVALVILAIVLLIWLL